MSDFGNTFSPIAAKHHQCEWCFGPIPKGEKHKHYQGMYGGEWQNWRMHDECWNDYSASGESEFMPGEGEAPERIKAMMQREEYHP